MAISGSFWHHRAVPKPSGLMNDRERAICARVRRLRIGTGWTQTDFAHAIGVTRDRIASVEYARYPLRYWLADRICQKFNVCQEWLSSGNEPVLGYVEIAPETTAFIKTSELFSAAYERVIRYIVTRTIAETESLNRTVAAQLAAGRPADDLFENYLYSLSQTFFRRVPPPLQRKYFGSLMAASSEFFRRHAHVTPDMTPKTPKTRRADTSKKKSTLVLQAVSEFGNLLPVKPELTLRKLLARLNAATRNKGKKLELAKEFGVPLSNVSQWLHGKREPGGETTLKLLRWVQEQESKPKTTLGSASNTTKGKRPKERKHESNQTSGRKET